MSLSMPCSTHILRLCTLICGIHIAACSSGSDNEGPLPPENTFTLVVANSLGFVNDALITDAEEVVVQFGTITLTNDEGGQFTFNADGSVAVDLLSIANGGATSLVSGLTIPQDTYTSVTVEIEAAPGVSDSFVTLESGAEVELLLPSPATALLSFNTPQALGPSDPLFLVLDFNVPASITATNGTGDFVFTPSVDFVDVLQVGSLVGTVSPDLINAACANPALFAGNVYVFPGNVTPDDFDGADAEPEAVSAVALESDPLVQPDSFSVAFLEAETFTVSYTCDETDLSNVSEDLTFFDTQVVNVLTLEDVIDNNVATGQILFDLDPL